MRLVAVPGGGGGGGQPVEMPLSLKTLHRVLNCFSPLVGIGLNCHLNLFVEFNNLLIVFSNSFISFELEPRKFNSSNKSEHQKSIFKCF